MVNFVNNPFNQFPLDFVQEFGDPSVDAGFASAAPLDPDFEQWLSLQSFDPQEYLNAVTPVKRRLNATDETHAKKSKTASFSTGENAESVREVPFPKNYQSNREVRFQKMQSSIALTDQKKFSIVLKYLEAFSGLDEKEYLLKMVEASEQSQNTYLHRFTPENLILTIEGDNCSFTFNRDVPYQKLKGCEFYMKQCGIRTTEISRISKRFANYWHLPEFQKSAPQEHHRLKKLMIAFQNNHLKQTKALKDALAHFFAFQAYRMLKSSELAISGDSEDFRQLMRLLIYGPEDELYLSTVKQLLLKLSQVEHQPAIDGLDAAETSLIAFNDEVTRNTMPKNKGRIYIPQNEIELLQRLSTDFFTNPKPKKVPNQPDPMIKKPIQLKGISFDAVCNSTSIEQVDAVARLKIALGYLSTMGSLSAQEYLQYMKTHDDYLFNFELENTSIHVLSLDRFQFLSSVNQPPSGYYRTFAWLREKGVPETIVSHLEYLNINYWRNYKTNPKGGDLCKTRLIQHALDKLMLGKKFNFEPIQNAIDHFFGLQVYKLLTSSQLAVLAENPEMQNFYEFLIQGPQKDSNSNYLGYARSFLESTIARMESEKAQELLTWLENNGNSASLNAIQEDPETLETSAYSFQEVLN